MKVVRKYVGSIYKVLFLPFQSNWQVYKREGSFLLLNKKTMMDLGFIKFKKYEEEIIDFMEKSIAERDIHTFIDIGSNIGFYSVKIGMLSCITKVYSFEPIHKLFHQTAANILINGLYDKWTGFNSAASNVDGEQNIFFNDYFLGTSSLSPTWTERSNQSLKIKTQKIDHSIKLSGERILIKIDVEGWEDNVIDGMHQTLTNNEVVLVIETDNIDLISKKLASLGLSPLPNYLNSPRDFIFSNF